MTSQTEAKLRNIARKENWSEVQFIFVKEGLLKLAEIDYRVTLENIMKKVKQAA